LSQSDRELPLCGIYFNLQSPYQMSALEKATKPPVEKTRKPGN